MDVIVRALIKITRPRVSYWKIRL